MTSLWKNALIALIAISTSSFAFAQETDKKQDEQQEQDQDKDERSLRERLMEAQMASQEDRSKSIELLEKIQKDFPETPQIALIYIGETQREASELSTKKRSDGNDYYYKSAIMARKIMDDPQLDPRARDLIATAIYNEACSLGVDGKLDKAKKVLIEAFDYGFNKYDLATEDSDFGELLETEEFKKIIADARENAANKKKDEANKELAALKTKIADFESFDFDFEIDSLDDETYSNESLAGKIVVVDLWSTGSPECARESESIVKLKSTYKDQLEILGLAFERGDDDEAYDAVVKFMEKNDVNYPCALGDEEIRDQLPNFRKYPTKVFLDGKGNVRYVKEGESSFEELEVIVKELMNSGE